MALYLVYPIDLFCQKTLGKTVDYIMFLKDDKWSGANKLFLMWRRLQLIIIREEKYRSWLKWKKEIPFESLIWKKSKLKQKNKKNHEKICKNYINHFY